MNEQSVIKKYVINQLLINNKENNYIIEQKVYTKLAKEQNILRTLDQKEVLSSIKKYVEELKDKNPVYLQTALIETKTNQKIQSQKKNIPKQRTSKYSIREIESKISLSGVTHISPSFSKGGFIDFGQIRNHYYSLIQNKTLKDDKLLMDDIIQHRKQILQKRITCDVSLFSKGQVVASMKIYQILLEHGQEVVTWWLGKQIDPSSFSQFVLSFKGYMEQFDVNNVVATQPPFKKVTVENVTTQFTFA